ncbi:hypothetical protein OG596_23710 [Streptomyces sp. NBC_01102]|uniref:hypothetical protein n=1 Tax=Streptomyces sp. NBC_01102 TaxID=2903749 RepID=UPI00386F4680|nr:hypothetical protein OG596_23710 [Streptomyces sp. NBC_01102]
MEIAELVLKYVEALVWPLVTVALAWGLRAHIKEAIGRLTRLETPAGSLEFAQQARELLDEAQRLTDPRSRRPDGAGLAPPDPAPLPEPVPASLPEPVHVPLPEPDPAPVTDTDVPPPPEFRPGGEPGSGQPQPDPGPPTPRWVYGDGPPSATRGAPSPWAVAGDERRGSMRMLPRGREEHVLPEELFTDATAMASASPVGAVITAWTTLGHLGADILRQYGVPVDRSRFGAHDIPRLLDGLTVVGMPRRIDEVLSGLRRLRDIAVHRPESVTPEAARDFVDSCRQVAAELRLYVPAFPHGPSSRRSRTPSPGDVGGRA